MRLSQPPPGPADSGIAFADGWQFAQSPKRRDVAAGCAANYNRDGSCYPPGVDPVRHLHVDLSTALAPTRHGAESNDVISRPNRRPAARKILRKLVVAQFEKCPKTGVILKDLARIATLAARVYIRSAPDPSQAQDDRND